jgi:hypothetical protein
MDPKPNQLSGMTQPVPNELSAQSAGAPGEGLPALQPAPVKGPSGLRQFVSSLLGRLVIIGAIVAVSLLVRNYVGGSAGDLKVGDCFDIPTSVGEVKDVQHHPCTDTHGAEVYFVGDYPAADGAPYPSAEAFDTFVADVCLPAFKAYTGSDPLEQLVLDGGYFFPTSEGWAEKDHGMICYLYPAGEQPTRQSYRGTNP